MIDAQRKTRIITGRLFLVDFHHPHSQQVVIIQSAVWTSGR